MNTHNVIIYIYVVGSSKNITSGLRINSMAIDIRLRSPPDNFNTNVFCLSYNFKFSNILLIYNKKIKPLIYTWPFIITIITRYSYQDVVVNTESYGIIFKSTSDFHRF